MQKWPSPPLESGAWAETGHTAWKVGEKRLQRDTAEPQGFNCVSRWGWDGAGKGEIELKGETQR